MNEFRGLGEALSNAAAVMLGRLASYLPSVLAAVLLLLAGWVLARVMRAVTSRAVGLLDTVLPRLGLPAGVSRLRAARGAVVAGTVVFWVVLLLFVTAATQVLGLQPFTDWLAKLIDYLPTLAAGLLIFAAGWILSGFAADLVQATVTRLEPGQRQMLARSVRATILVGAILVGADQIGIRVTFLAIFAGAVAVTIGGAVAVAAGLGSREYVANLIAAHQLRHAFATGQTIRIAGHEGRMLEVTTTSVIIETAEGRVMLPARLFNDHPVAVKARGDHG